MFKVSNINTRRRCEICSKLKIKTSERRIVKISKPTVSEKSIDLFSVDALLETVNYIFPFLATMLKNPLFRRIIFMQSWCKTFQ